MGVWIRSQNKVERLQKVVMELEAENSKLRAVAEIARKVYREFAIDGYDNIDELGDALFAAGYGGEK